MEQILANNGKLDDTMIIVNMTGEVYRQFMAYRENEENYIQSGKILAGTRGEQQIKDLRSALSTLVECVEMGIKVSTISSVGEGQVKKASIYSNSAAVSASELVEACSRLLQETEI